MSQNRTKTYIFLGIAFAGLFVLFVVNMVVNQFDKWFGQPAPVTQKREAPRTAPPKRSRKVIYYPPPRYTKKATAKNLKKADKDKRKVPRQSNFPFPQPPPPGPRLPPPPKPSSNFYVLNRKKLKAILNRPLAESGAIFSPNIFGGRPRGIKVSTLQEGSIYRRFGLMKGDILISVNKRTILTPGHARKWEKVAVREYRNLTLEIQRGKKTYTLDFSLR